MRKIYFLIIAFIPATFIYAQNSGPRSEDLNLSTGTEIKYSPALTGDFDNNGFRYESFNTATNTKYSDFAIGIFREKFITYSANKIGGLSKIDPITNEPYTNLYCSSITTQGDLNRPLLFSGNLNSSDNMGSATFSHDELTIFYTTSTKENSKMFKLYRADMDPEKLGKWIDNVALPFNGEEYSIENPHLSEDGYTLYFSSNMPGSIGGYDIFQVAVNSDGSYGNVIPVKGMVNTKADEKFPHLSIDEKYLYFSSNGHQNIGGFDIFRSRKYKGGYSFVLNLGNTINTKDNEIAYVPASNHSGYYSSNKTGGTGSYDIYAYKEEIVSQKVNGTVRDSETYIPLENILVSLIDADGNQESVQITDAEGQYSFPVEGYENYRIIAARNGFELNTTTFNTNTKLVPVFNTQILLIASAAPIVKNDKGTYLEIENIRFNYNSSRIEPFSMPVLNGIVRTLNENPKLKINIKAHTDSQGIAKYNQDLSESRARTAKNYLVLKGIAKDRMKAIGFGKSQPLVECDPCTEEQHETNRRIEFSVID